MNKIYTAIQQERIRQDKKHGFQTDAPFKMLAALMEELGEVAEAMVDDGIDHSHTEEELIQVAALAVKMIEQIHCRKEQMRYL